MYKEVYGKEPERDSKEESRIINFDFDEEYAEEELLKMANEIFDNEIWKEVKQEIKEADKKEIARSMFGLGFATYYKMLNEDIKAVKDNPEITKKIEEILNEREKSKVIS